MTITAVLYLFRLEMMLDKSKFSSFLIPSQIQSVEITQGNITNTLVWELLTNAVQ